MNMVIASIVFVLLFTIALAYFLWSIGSRWPVRDPELLARTVVGRPNVTRVPRVKAFVYAIFALAAGIVALSVALFLFILLSWYMGWVKPTGIPTGR